MKETLHSGYVNDVDPFLVDGLIPEGEYQSVKNSIHSAYVAKAKREAGIHPLLGTPPPPLHPSASTLPRHYQTTMSRNRSGYCILLNDYLHRIGRIPSPLCPHCNAADQTSLHLFDCTAFPTDFLFSNLWSRPRDVARFLSNHPTSSSLGPLPPLNPPIPLPPPEPPPIPPLMPPLVIPPLMPTLPLIPPLSPISSLAPSSPLLFSSSPSSFPSPPSSPLLFSSSSTST